MADGAAPARAKVKALWYLLFAVVGTFHAEVLSWSSPAVLYNPFNFLITVPVYAVHYIVFGDIILRRGRCDFFVLYTFGCLTGMYEFVITKVYFVPPWDPTHANLPLGIAWLEVLWIGFVWHAFMSFYLPARIMLVFFAPGGAGKLAPLEKRLLFVLVPLASGATGLLSGHGLPDMFLSIGLSFVVIGAVAFAYVRASRAASLFEARALVLGKRGRRVAWALFFGVYGFYGLALRPEGWKVGLPLVGMAALYALLIALLRHFLETATEALPVGPAPAPAPSAVRDHFRGFVVALALGYGGLFAALFVAPVLVLIVLGLFVYGGAALGAGLLGWITFVAVRGRPLPRARAGQPELPAGPAR